MDCGNSERRTALEAAADTFGVKTLGVADLGRVRERDPEALKAVPRTFDRAVVVGMRLQQAVLEGIEDRPTPLYFHNYRQLNYQLDRCAWHLADRLQDTGYRAIAIPASQIVVRDPMRGQVSHRHLGVAAGLGHIGRNNLLVHPRHGSQLRYVSVLTDAPLAPGVPLETDCGTCRACCAVCPAGAIGESKDAFNLSACYEKLCEFTRLPFIGQHVCGICVKACRGMTEDRGQMTDDRGQTTDDRGQRTDDRGRMTEDGGQRTDDGGRMTEGKS